MHYLHSRFDSKRKYHSFGILVFAVASVLILMYLFLPRVMMAEGTSSAVVSLGTSTSVGTQEHSSVAESEGSATSSLQEKTSRNKGSEGTSSVSYATSSNESGGVQGGERATGTAPEASAQKDKDDPGTSTSQVEGAGQQDGTGSHSSTSTQEIRKGSRATSVDNEGDWNASSTEDAMSTQNGTTTLDTPGNMAASTTASTTSMGEVGSTTASTTIKTGTSTAYASILNNVNTTLLNSSGIIKLISGDNVSGNVDLTFGSSTDVAQKLSELGLENLNKADITNKAIVIADTGHNILCHASGTAMIETGDAKVGANVVNFANNTFVDSKYTVVSGNVLGNFLGSLILPGESFFEKVGQFVTHHLDLNISNTGSATTTAVSTSTTGNNLVESGSSSAVKTGKSGAYSQIGNYAGNLGIGGTPYVHLSFHVGGDWGGKIYNLPKGIEYKKTPTGFTLTSDFLPVGTSTSGGDAGTMAIASSSLKSTSTARIVNDISLGANTGGNTTCGVNTNINTGDAQTSLSVLNLFNNTFIGKNYLYGLVSIGGDWDGSIEFGEPDLVVLGTANVDTTKKGVYAGSDVKVTYMVFNNGTADASGVHLSSEPGKYLSAKDVSPGSVEKGDVNWALGTISPGAHRKVSYTVRVSKHIPYGTTYAKNEATVSAVEPDANTEDNTEEISIPLYRKHPHHFSSYSGGSRYRKEKKTPVPPKFHLTKTNDAFLGVIAPSSTVNYTVVVDNNGGKAYGAVLHDVLMGPSGSVMKSQRWMLGMVKPEAEITVKYELFYNIETRPGNYTNRAYVTYYLKKKGQGGEVGDQEQDISPRATSTVLVRTAPTSSLVEPVSRNTKASSTVVGVGSSTLERDATGSVARIDSNDDDGIIHAAHAAGASARKNLAAAGATNGFPDWPLYIIFLLLLAVLYFWWHILREEGSPQSFSGS